MIAKLWRTGAQSGLGLFHPSPGTPKNLFNVLWMVILIAIVIAAVTLSHSTALASVRLPGEDASDKMETVGTLLRFIDTGLFKWGARVLAGLAILSAGWALKEMRFGVAVISIISAILFGTAPTWVKNIFSMSGSDSVFSQIEYRGLPRDGKEARYG